MAERFFDLSESDRRDALRFAESQTGRPAYLLEKDVWVVWSLSALFGGPLAGDLTFKGGTSLSKVYQAIDRFSEDVDVTYDIRKSIPDLIGDGGPIPSNNSQQKKWSEAVKNRLPTLLDQTIKPMIEKAISKDGLDALLRVEPSAEKEASLLVHYARVTDAPDYVAPWVRLEFGARATGEPHDFHDVRCDMENVIPDLALPTARAQVMLIERTFWEKATAAHVFCAKQTFRGDGERFSRHWLDLSNLFASEHFPQVRDARDVAMDVARHKAVFFREKAADGTIVDYEQAVSGLLRLVPEGEARQLLKDDYEKMADSNMIFSAVPAFDDIMSACETMANELNAASGHRPQNPS